MIKYFRIFLDRYFYEIFWCFFVILGIMGVLHHDMWRDELQAWMIVKASHSLSELSFNLRYESHPPLWYWLLMLVQRFSSNPISMQWVHLGIASLSAWLILKLSPFNRLQKVLLIFGYFLFYEYSLMCRSYALGVLLIFIFCIVVTRPGRNYLFLSLILILLALTSMMGLIMAVSLGAFLVFEFFENRSSRNEHLPQAALAILLLIVALCFSFKSMIPPPDSGYIKSLIGVKIVKNFLFLMDGVYLPDKFSLFPLGVHRSLLIFSLFVLMASLLFFVRKKSVLFLYLFGILLFVSFFLNASSYPRHAGQLFILLIACWWVYPKISRIANWFIIVLLSIQFFLGIGTYLMCLNHQESDGKQAAGYIQIHGLDDLPMIGDAYGASCVAGYLGEPIYYAREHRWGTFVLYNNQKEPSHRQVLESARDFSKKFKKNTLLILTYPLSNFLLENPDYISKVQELAILDRSVEKFSKIYLYLYKYDKHP